MDEVVFEPTPPMSSYLACFIICDFEKESAWAGKRETALAAFARNEQIERINHGLQVLHDILGFYESYFGKNWVRGVPHYTS